MFLGDGASISICPLGELVRYPLFATESNYASRAATAVIIIFYLHLHDTQAAKKERTLWDLILSLDPVGLFLFVPAIVCILLALQVRKNSHLRYNLAYNMSVGRNRIQMELRPHHRPLRCIRCAPPRLRIRPV